MTDRVCYQHLQWVYKPTTTNKATLQVTRGATQIEDRKKQEKEVIV